MPAPDPRVVIVGAGPAGTATAIGLRRRGVPVALYDRARFPRDKVCGDVVLPAATRALSALGLDPGEVHALGYRCRGARYTTPFAKSIAAEFRSPAGEPAIWHIVKRSVLDAWLVASAQRLGAELHEASPIASLLFDGASVRGVRVEPRRGRPRDVEAAFVVGADGATSAVAREVGRLQHPPAHTCLAVRGYASDLALPEPLLEVFASARTLPGCAWILPTGPREANVGLGVVKRTSQREGATPRELFEHVREAIPLFGRRLAGARLSALRGWSLPGATQRRALTGPGFCLVGDAGAMVDPFTGHGIHHALEAGLAAADAIADALERGARAPVLNRYERWWRASHDREIAIGGALQKVHGVPWLTRIGLALAGRSAPVADALFGLVGHTAPREELLPRPLASLLWRAQGAA